MKSGTVVILTALPTCINITNCHECANAQLKHFQCSWCAPKPGESGDGGNAEDTNFAPFCSDQLGLNRRRRQWVESNCAVGRKNQHCSAESLLVKEVDKVRNRDDAKCEDDPISVKQIHSHDDVRNETEDDNKSVSVFHRRPFQKP